jgi:protein gp37
MLIEMFPNGVPANVRIGATIVNQIEANRDLRKVAQVMVATILKPFLSMEPLLGRVDLASGHIAWHRFVGWVIIGGESGPNARMMDPWAASQLVDQCARRQVPVLFKQWGEWGPVSGSTLPGDVIVSDTDEFVRTGIQMRRIGKVAAGRQIHGREYTEFPK